MLSKTKTKPKLNRFEIHSDDSDSLDNDDYNTSSSSEESKTQKSKKSTIIEIERELDDNVVEYSKYDKNNPMIGISYDKSKKCYVINYESMKNVKMDSLKNACETVMNRISVENYNIIPIKDVIKIISSYGNASIICYEYQKKYYYDVQHISFFLSVDKSEINKKHIVHSFWEKNKYDGYLLRELMPANKLRKIIISSIDERKNMLINLAGFNFSENDKKYYTDCIITAFAKNLIIESKYKIGEYVVDMYIPDYNLVIELDRKYKSDYNKKYEKKRKQYIQDNMDDKLVCKFITFDPHKPMFNMNKVISEIYEFMMS